MGMKWHIENDIEWGEFPELTALGLRHGMSTRSGGISRDKHESLNLGLMADKDNPDRTLENRRRFFNAVGVSMDQLATFRQIHSDIVEKVEASGIHDTGADGVITKKEDIVLLTLAADCVPVIIADPVTRALAVIHSGWRGTAKRIVAKAAERMEKEYGSQAEDLWVGIGPAIGECCYEVSREVFEETWKSTRSSKIANSENPHLDLRMVIREQLLEIDVPEKQILIAKHCTQCESDRFFSHRAGAGGRCGLIASWPSK